MDTTRMINRFSASYIGFCVNIMERTDLFTLAFTACCTSLLLTRHLFHSDTLREVNMPCAIVTHLDSSQLDAVLNATGLAEYFPPDKRVSSDSNYESERSELLGATLRLEQRSDKCVIFDNTPHSANEAHEVCMKSVSFVDHYVRYELLTADLSVGYARDLDLITLAKLFDERTDFEPELELDVSSGLQKQQRKVKTA